MSFAKARKYLEVVTNVAVLIAAAVIIGVFVKSYIGGKPAKPAPPLPKGEILADIKDVNFADAPKTLVFALSSGCRYCIQSVPFYQTLASMQANLAGRVRMVAVFPEDEAAAKSFLGKSLLQLDLRSDVDFSSLKIPATPALILVDNTKTIVNSWIGALSKEREREVLDALKKDLERARADAAADVKQTFSLFDDRSAALTVDLENAKESDLSRAVNHFAVDGQGNIFLNNGDKLLKFDGAGTRLAEGPLPADFKGNFCADADGNTYYPSNASVIVYDPSLKLRKTIPLTSVLKPESMVLKAEIDRRYKALYLQVYDPDPLAQSLYKLDLGTNQVTPVFKLEKPVPFSPTLSPGAFDFALGQEHLYVSDIREYKIFVYSLKTGKYVTTFSQPSSANPILEDDGNLKIRKVRVGGITSGENALVKYPPILHLNVTNNGQLVVWTSQRNHEGKQVADVFDDQFRLIGRDLKYAHPSISNYLFLNGNVYVPNFGFDKNVEASDLSPLEVPSLPQSLKVFHEAVPS